MPKQDGLIQAKESQPEERKKLQKISPHNTPPSGSADEACSLIVESGLSQQNQRILAERTYKMIGKLAEFIEFLVVLNAHEGVSLGK